MNEQSDKPPETKELTADTQLQQDTRTWAMILHFSLLACFVVPIAGLVAPVIIWQIKKDQLPAIDAHGRVVMNWLISCLVYFVVCLPLVFIGIGLLLIYVLSILYIVFAIVGGLKANEGTVWRYPMSIPVFTITE